VEYLDNKAFLDFLHHRQKANAGILQRFVEPRGVHNGQRCTPCVGVCPTCHPSWLSSVRAARLCLFICLCLCLCDQT
jgi:hypothetical protein